METLTGSASASTSASRGRILVVDDHQDMLHLLAQIVTGEGYQACLAGNGMEALWRAAHQPPDLILLDIRMPGMNGLEVARALKRHAATDSIPIIIVSAADSPEDRIAGFEAGAVDFIAKPFIDHEVLARIDTHMQMSLVRTEVLRRHHHHRDMMEDDAATTTETATSISSSTTMADRPVNILIVEDTPESLRLLANILQDAGFSVREAPGGELALWSAIRHPPDLILMDMRMPGMNGAEACFALKNDGQTHHVPVIMLSAEDDAATRSESQAAGAVDFIAKPFDEHDLLARIRMHLPVQCQTHLPHQGHEPLHDPLTCRPAATAFAATWAAADRLLEELLSSSPQAALLLDMQGQVCYVNPAFVQLTGQELHTLDAVFLQRLQHLYTVQTPELRCMLPGLPVSCTAYIARLPIDPSTDSRLARIIVLSMEMSSTLSQRVPDAASALFRELATFTTQPMNTPYPGLEETIREALGRHELRLLYQPIYDLITMRPLATEALLRWQHPQHGLLAPESFLALTEETGAILEIGRWVLDQAVLQQLRWQGTQRLGMAINISSMQFWQDSLVQDVADTLRRHALTPSDLMIEVAASSLHEDPSQGIAILHRLKALGVTLTLDRCHHESWLTEGLARLPVDIIKLDPTLWQTLDPLGQSANIMRDWVDLSHAMNRRVAVNGIEHPTQLSLLSLCHCDMGQGYLLGRPAPAPAQAHFVADGHG